MINCCTGGGEVQGRTVARSPGAGHQPAWTESCYTGCSPRHADPAVQTAGRRRASFVGVQVICFATHTQADHFQSQYQSAYLSLETLSLKETVGCLSNIFLNTFVLNEPGKSVKPL